MEFSGTTLSKAALEADLADAAVIALIDEVLLSAIALLESHPLRASDATQISSALLWKADLCASADAANAQPDRLPTWKSPSSERALPPKLKLTKFSH